MLDPQIAQTGPSAQTAAARTGRGEQSLAVQTRNDMLGLLKKYEKQIAAAIPKHLTVERMLRLTVGAMNQNPKLFECTPGSVLNSVLYLSQLGLEPRVNEAYLIPFNVKNVLKCTPVIDYRGKIKLARQSGLVRDIEPHIVYARDKFDLRWSTDPAKRGLVHEPLLFTRGEDGTMSPVNKKDRGVPVLGYVIVWLTDGDPHVEVMTVAEIEHIRSKSRASSDGPWVTDWDEMARKTLVHRGCKTAPQSPEMAQAQDMDGRADVGLELAPIIELDERDDVPMIAQSADAAQEVAQRKIAAAATPATPVQDLETVRFDSIEPGEPEPVAEPAPKRQMSLGRRG
jgi:recombination protein RecT